MFGCPCVRGLWLVSPCIDIAELERLDDVLGRRPATAKDPVQHGKVDPFPPRPGRLASGSCDLGAQHADDVLLVEHGDPIERLMPRGSNGKIHLGP